MEYSPISKVIIKNFRNIGDIELSFSESPIIVLLGDNESGKTSCVKAIKACALNEKPKEQKDKIRDGTKGFGVAIELEDGTLITRMKTATLNMYRINYPDGTEWVTSKITDKGVPYKVQELMGLVEEQETKEPLNVRTYEEQLLFVYTPASTNSKVMYNALKVGKLDRAIKNGKAEAVEYAQAMQTNSIKIQAFNESLRKVIIYDVTALKNIQKSIDENRVTLLKTMSIGETKDKIRELEKQLGTLKLIDDFKLTEISEIEARLMIGAYSNYKRTKELIDKREHVKDVNGLEIIDTNNLIMLKSAMDSIGSCRERQNRLDKIKEEVGSLSNIDEQLFLKMEEATERKRKVGILENENNNVSKINELEDLSKDVKIMQSMISAINILKAEKEKASRLNELSIEITEGNRKLVEMGVDVEICPNCGEQVIIDITKYIKQGA